MSGESRYDEGIADIKEQIRQIEANQAEDFDGSCTAVIIDMPHAKAILARHSALSAIGETQAPSGMAMLMDSAPTVQEAINETMARRRAESPVSHDGDTLRQQVMQAMGSASMCWTPTPAGVFDSEAAMEVGERLLAAIEKHSALSATVTTPTGTEIAMREAPTIYDTIMRAMRDHYWDSLEPQRDLVLLHIEAALKWFKMASPESRNKTMESGVEAADTQAPRRSA